MSRRANPWTALKGDHWKRNIGGTVDTAATGHAATTAAEWLVRFEVTLETLATNTAGL